MNRLLEQADPALGLEVDRDRFRALVDERIGLSPVVKPHHSIPVRPWVILATAFLTVLAIAIPSLLNRSTPSPDAAGQALTQLPGFDAVISLASGGVQTMGHDGEDIWVVSALAHKLQKISMSSNEIEETFDLDEHVEGVVVGGGYLWLLSYDNGGEVLRFDPRAGAIDIRVPLGGLPSFARWFDGRLFASNDQDQLVEISPDGDILSTSSGSLKGDGLDHLWLLDPEDGSIRSMASDGATGEFVIPGSTPEFGDLSQVRLVGEAGGYLWLIFGEASESVGRFDPGTGELAPLHVGRWLHSLTEHDGRLWLTSLSDDLLFRVDPETGETSRFALPGKPGGIQSGGGALWALLHQPGSLLRLDTSDDLIEIGEEVASSAGGSVSGFDHRLICTLGGVDTETVDRVRVDHDFEGVGPTIVLEAPSWIGGGIWSVVQAQISGHVVCASGYSAAGATPEQRAADLQRSLEDAGVPGPFVLVAAGDGAHSARLFMQGRDDIAGVVFVEPMPIGFQEYYDGLLDDSFTHPEWQDIDHAVSDSLDDLGDVPVAVIGHDPEAVFLSDGFVESIGLEKAESISDYWQRGLEFYEGLSRNSYGIVVPDTGFDGVIWFRPDLILEVVLQMAGGR